MKLVNVLITLFVLLNIIHLSANETLESQQDGDNVEDSNLISPDETLEEYLKANNISFTKKMDIIKFIPPKESKNFSGKYIINNDTIQKSTASNIPELLQQHAGINIQKENDLQNSYQISLSGSPSKHTLILLDGIQIDNSTGEQTFLNIGQFPIQFVEEIEIIRGPSVVSYGRGALAGVINIKTKKYNHNLTSIKQEIGTNSSLISQAASNIHLNNKFNFTIIGSFFKTDKSLLLNSNDDFEEDFTNNDVDNIHNVTNPTTVNDIHLKLDYKFSPNANISAFWKYGKHTEEYDRYDINDLLSYYSNQKSSLAAFVYKFNLFSNFNNSISISQHIIDHVYDIQPEPVFRDKFNLYSNAQSISYDASYLIKNINIRGGARFATKRLKNIDYIEEANDTLYQSVNDLSGYLNIQEYLYDNLSLEQGLRINQNQRNISGSDSDFYNNTAYSFGIAYDLSPNSFMKLIYGHNYRNPTLYELFGYDGNQYLKRETSHGINVEISSQSFYGFLQQVNMNFFYQNVNDMIYFTNGQYQNSDSLNKFGFDINLPLYIEPLSNLTIIPNYTYTNSNPMSSSDVNFVDLPNHKISASFNLNVTDKIDLSWNTIWVSSSVVIMENKKYNVPSYVLSNALLSANFNEISSLYFRINNIFNEQITHRYAQKYTQDRSFHIGINIQM